MSPALKAEYIRQSEYVNAVLAGQSTSLDSFFQGVLRRPAGLQRAIFSQHPIGLVADLLELESVPEEWWIRFENEFPDVDSSDDENSEVRPAFMISDGSTSPRLFRESRLPQHAAEGVAPSWRSAAAPSEIHATGGNLVLRYKRESTLVNYSAWTRLLDYGVRVVFLCFAFWMLVTAHDMKSSLNKWYAGDLVDKNFDLYLQP